MKPPGYKSIDMSVDSWLTPDQHLSQKLVESWLIFADTPLIDKP